MKRITIIITAAAIILGGSIASAATINGTPGDDDCQNGHKCLVGTPNGDQIYADNGDDVADGRGGGDILGMGPGGDYAFGGDGSDWINGGNGNDTLKGEGGDDTVQGTGDNGDHDVLVGNGGNDVCTLGEGDYADLFTCEHVNGPGSKRAKRADNKVVNSVAQAIAGGVFSR